MTGENEVNSISKDEVRYYKCIGNVRSSFGSRLVSKSRRWNDTVSKSPKRRYTAIWAELYDEMASFRVRRARRVSKIRYRAMKMSRRDAPMIAYLKMSNE